MMSVSNKAATPCRSRGGRDFSVCLSDNRWAGGRAVAAPMKMDARGNFLGLSIHS